MPRITSGRRNAPAIGDLRHLVWITTTIERPDPDTPGTIRERPGVYETRARIRNLRPDVILDWAAVFGTQNNPTIEITIRNPPDVKIDLNHWVYREDGPTRIWYKVKTVEDLGGVGLWLVLGCAIDTLNDERSDPATQEPPPRWDDPSRIAIVRDRI